MAHVLEVSLLETIVFVVPKNGNVAVANVLEVFCKKLVEVKTAESGSNLTPVDVSAIDRGQRNASKGRGKIYV